MKRQMIISLAILAFLILGTAAAILYATGYRFNFYHGRPDISLTGLFVVTSSPDGAQVFIDNHLTTATDNTITLTPRIYSIKIFKQGYFPWKKNVTIKKGVVSNANALLFPSAPQLESLTDTGVLDPVLDPSQTRIAYLVGSQSATATNGVYVLNMTAKPLLTLQNASMQVADDTIGNFSNGSLSWSPDGIELIATVSATTYLLQANNFNQNPTDITETLPTLAGNWKQEILTKEQERISTLPSTLKSFVKKDFKILAWSPDETKILYEATQSSTLPLIINPPLIGTDSKPQIRTIQPGSLYIYDIHQDKNFFIPVNYNDLKNGTDTLSFFPDSLHLIYVHNGKIDIMEYDGSNDTTIYAGPFINHYVFPWPDGSKIVILTNLDNQNTAPNLYSINLQ